MVLQVFIYIWDLFKLWIHTLFGSPFQNTEMFWILIPLWLAWFFAEFFQEKRGTSMGNAISNAIIILWASIDCARQTFFLMSKKSIQTGTIFLIQRFSLLLIIFLFGLIVIILGIKGKPVIRKIGRIRIVSYMFFMFVPIFYNAMPLDAAHMLSAIVFFPIYYGVIELIDKIIPNPKAFQLDTSEDSPHISKTSYRPTYPPNSGFGNNPKK